jgi:DNA repair protein RadB
LTHKSSEYVPTNCTCLNSMLGGGIPKRQVTLVYGEANTGKTTLALQCAAALSRENLKTLYVDCENSFSLERLAQIASKDLPTISSRIFVFKLQRFHDQVRLLEDMDRYVSKGVALIVIDPITSLYRLELKNPRRVFSLNRSLNRQIAYLTQTVKTHDVAVLIISQVHNIIQGNQDMLIEPVATRVLKFWSQSIMKMQTDPKPSVRRILLEKHPNSARMGAYCTIRLSRTGIVSFSRPVFPKDL